MSSILRLPIFLAMSLAASGAAAEAAIPAPQAVAPASIAAAPDDAALEKAWLAEDYDFLEEAATRPHTREDDKRIGAWFSQKIAKGGGFVTLQLAARSQWRAGLPSAPDERGDKDLLFKAASLFLSAYGDLHIAGVRCRDPDARQARLEQLSAEHPRIVQFIATMPDDWRDKVVADAVALEARNRNQRRFEAPVCGPALPGEKSRGILAQTAYGPAETKQKSNVQAAIADYAKSLAAGTNPSPPPAGRPAIVETPEPAVVCKPVKPIASARRDVPGSAVLSDADDERAASSASPKDGAACLDAYRTSRDPACLDTLLRRRQSEGEKITAQDEKLVGVLTGVFATNPAERDRLTEATERYPAILQIKIEALMRASQDKLARALLDKSKTDGVTLGGRRHRLPSLPLPESSDALAYLEGLYLGSTLLAISDAQFADAMRVAMVIEKYGPGAHAPDRPDLRAQLCARYFCGTASKRFQETLGSALSYQLLRQLAVKDTAASAALKKIISARPSAPDMIARERSLLAAYDALASADGDDPRRDRALAAYERFETPAVVESRMKTVGARPAVQAD